MIGIGYGQMKCLKEKYRRSKMLKEITLPYDSWWDVSNYPESGFYKVIDRDRVYIAKVFVVLKEAGVGCLIFDYTEDIEKSINKMFQNYFKRELDSKSIISFDDVLKAIAVTQDPKVIKDLVR